MKKPARKKRKVHDAFFMQMAASCAPDESGVNDFEKKNEELLASWLEYNASHGEKMRKKSLSPRKKQ
jgi:hypothetical protein